MINGILIAIANPNIVQDFFLFIDTETSGLPKNWTAPYDKEKNWPYIIQLAWVIFDQEYREIKRANYFIKCTDFKIEKSSQKIHHITEAFLMMNGGSREDALEALNQDLIKYQPLVVGHFMEFDYHMVNAEHQRIGKPTELNHLPLFCTMKASAPFVNNPAKELLKLNEFYEELFNEAPEAFHQALADAINTSRIFFELRKMGKVTAKSIKQQNNNFTINHKASNPETAKSFISRLFSF